MESLYSKHAVCLWQQSELILTHLQFYHLFFLYGIASRPERPAPLPDSTRARIQIPLIIPPLPSSPRQPYNPIQPVQPNKRVINIPPLRQPSSPQRPSHPAGIPEGPVRPVMETGEAGPPGYIRRVTVRRGSEHSSSLPVQGFAGAPGERCHQTSFYSNFALLTIFVQ